MKKRIFCILIFFVQVSLLVKSQNSILFFEEHIDFSIDSIFFSINGIYSFYNNSNEIANQHIIFPFAVKTTLIDSIKIIDLNSLKMLPFDCLGNAISFNLMLMPKDTLNINIFYRQKTSFKNTYIITTTKTWGSPLDKAIYRLTIPKAMTINSFSYIPDSIKIVDDKILYFWDKYHFTPQIEFDVIVDKFN